MRPLATTCTQYHVPLGILLEIFITSSQVCSISYTIRNIYLLLKIVCGN